MNVGQIKQINLGETSAHSQSKEIMLQKQEITQIKYRESPSIRRGNLEDENKDGMCEENSNIY